MSGGAALLQALEDLDRLALHHLQVLHPALEGLVEARARLRRRVLLVDLVPELALLLKGLLGAGERRHLAGEEDRDPARSRGGLGIGLALARRLAELHGGSVTARSQGPGRGAEFEVRLPLAVNAAAPETPAEVEAEPQAPAVPAAVGLARRALIVEDNQDVGDSLAALIAMMGCEVQQARNGAAGIALAVTDPPDVVLLDIGLPGLDGYEVARRLRQQLPASAPTRLYALTGYTQPEDRRRATAAGFDGFLAKPVDMATLGVVLQGPRPGAEGSRAGSERAGYRQ